MKIKYFDVNWICVYRIIIAWWATAYPKRYEQPINNDKILQKNSIRPYGKKQNWQVFKICYWRNNTCCYWNLIALQINNWNERRLEANQEKIILSNLNEEFQDNLKDLDSINLNLLNTIGHMENLFSRFKEKQSQNMANNLDGLIGHSLSSPSWKPSEFILNDLKNSGGLSKLKSSKLRKQLFQWTRFFNQMKENETQMEKSSLDIINFLKANGSLRNADVTAENFNYDRSQLQIDNERLLLSPQFENHIDDKLLALNQIKDQFVQAKQLINQILKETSFEEL